MAQYRGVAVGAGYFSHFQYEAWDRIPEVRITAICNRNAERAGAVMEKWRIPNHYTDYREMLEKEKPDALDIAVSMELHAAYARTAAEYGVAILCQKPMTPTGPLTESSERR